MKRTPITPNRDQIPDALQPFLEHAAVYDSSCSPAARVWFLDKEKGYYLKNAPAGSLAREAAMTTFFHQKGLAAEVLAYESGDSDWLLTSRLPGEDCIFPPYLEDPVRLCETTGTLLRMLHETDPAGCPVPNRTADYLTLARTNHAAGQYDLHLFDGRHSFANAADAWRMVEEGCSALQADTLIHGDYCLPNIMLHNWQFSGFLDLDTAGVGDRHVDLFWGIWTLQFNLKTDRYANRFLDAYGRDVIEEDRLQTVAAIEIFG